MLPKILVNFLVLLLISQVSYAQEEQDSQKKSFTQYLLFRKEIIVTKSSSWSLLSEIRNLGRIENWPSSKQKEEIVEADEIFKSLSKPLKNFSSYEVLELKEEVNSLKETKNKISAARLEIKRRTNLHKQIKDQIILARKAAQDAYNKTKQVLEIRKTIESFYARKQSASYPQVGIDVITRHLETAQLLADISKMDFEIINLQKTESLGFSASSDNIYDPEQILQNLTEIHKQLKEISAQSVKDIKADSRTLVAVQAITAN